MPQVEPGGNNGLSIPMTSRQKTGPPLLHRPRSEISASGSLASNTHAIPSYQPARIKASETQHPRPGRDQQRPRKLATSTHKLSQGAAQRPTQDAANYNLDRSVSHGAFISEPSKQTSPRPNSTVAADAASSSSSSPRRRYSAERPVRTSFTHQQPSQQKLPTTARQSRAMGPTQSSLSRSVQRTEQIPNQPIVRSRTKVRPPIDKSASRALFCDKPQASARANGDRRVTSQNKHADSKNHSLQRECFQDRECSQHVQELGAELPTPVRREMQETYWQHTAPLQGSYCFDSLGGVDDPASRKWPGGFLSFLPGHKRPDLPNIQTENILLRQQLNHLRMTNEQLVADLAEFKSANDQFHRDLRDLQVQSFKEINRAHWTPLEDMVVQEVLDELHKDIEDWADENCVEHFEDISADLDPAEEKDLLEYFKVVAHRVDASDLSTQLRDWSMCENIVEPRHILTAIATIHIYTSIFDRPFLFAEAFAQGINENSPRDDKETSENFLPCEVDRAMHLVFKTLFNIDKKQASIWRSQFMRTLFPVPVGGRFSGLRYPKEEWSYLIPQHCEQLVAKFYSGAIRIFFKQDMPATGRAHLIDCWKRAAELVTQLQTHLSQLEWDWPPNVIGDYLDVQNAELHRSQHLQHSEGKVVVLVLSPTLAFRGDEDGTGYDKRRILSKAVVLIDVDEQDGDSMNMEEHNLATGVPAEQLRIDIDIESKFSYSSGARREMYGNASDTSEPRWERERH